jgi:hypothetical protein
MDTNLQKKPQDIYKELIISLQLKFEPILA